MKIKKADAYLFIFVVFAFQPIIERHISIFKYFDEIVVLVIFLHFIFDRRRLNRIQKDIIIGSIFLLAIGLIGNGRSGVNQPFAAVVQDVLSNMKFFVAALSFFSVSLNTKQQEELKDKIAKFIHCLFVVMFICAMANLVVDIGMSDVTEGKRFGFRAFCFLFDNPAGLNTYCYLYMILHSITLLKNGKLRKHSTFYTLLGVSVWFLTLRSRAIAFSLIYVALYIYLLYIRRSDRPYRFRWYQVFIVAAVALLLGWDAIEKYFISNDRVARYQLMYGAFKIAKQYLPSGSGFATFGTEASRAYYSSLYYSYGLSNIYGLSPSNASFITDQYWFSIIGQFGYVGLIIVGVMIFKVYKSIWPMSRSNRANQLAVFTFFYTSLFASLTAGTFIQASIIPSLLIFFLLRENNVTSYIKMCRTI